MHLCHFQFCTQGTSASPSACTGNTVQAKEAKMLRSVISPSVATTSLYYSSMKATFGVLMHYHQPLMLN